MGHSKAIREDEGEGALKEVTLTEEFYNALKAMSEGVGSTVDLALFRLVYYRLPVKVRRRVALMSAQELEEIAKSLSDREATIQLLAHAVSYLLTAVGDMLGVEVYSREDEREAIEFLAVKSGDPEVYTCYVKMGESVECARKLLGKLKEYVK